MAHFISAASPESFCGAQQDLFETKRHCSLNAHAATWRSLPKQKLFKSKSIKDDKMIKVRETNQSMSMTLRREGRQSDQSSFQTTMYTQVWQEFPAFHNKSQSRSSAELRPKCLIFQDHSQVYHAAVQGTKSKQSERGSGCMLVTACDCSSLKCVCTLTACDRQDEKATVECHALSMASI